MRYQAGAGSRMREFKAALRNGTAERQKWDDALRKNLSMGELPGEIVNDVGAQMKTLKEEITALQLTEPPKDFTVEMIGAWLNTLKAAPDDKAARLLIARIDTKTKTEFNIQSTLNTVLGEIGCGGQI